MASGENNKNKISILGRAFLFSFIYLFIFRSKSPPSHLLRQKIVAHSARARFIDYSAIRAHIELKTQSQIVGREERSPVWRVAASALRLII